MNVSRVWLYVLIYTWHERHEGADARIVGEIVRYSSKEEAVQAGPPSLAGIRRKWIELLVSQGRTAQDAEAGVVRNLNQCVGSNANYYASLVLVPALVTEEGETYYLSEFVKELDMGSDRCFEVQVSELT